ncbi:MAG: hypothetical protein V1799_13930 [bacterium]
MRRIYTVYIVLMLFVIVNAPLSAQGVVKEVNVGKLHTRVVDNGHQSETESGKEDNRGVAHYYFDGHNNTNRMFSRWSVRTCGTHIGIPRWRDTTGTIWPFMTAGAEQGTSDAEKIQFVVPDALGNTIYKYVRCKPPTVIVDGNYVNDPFPYDEMEMVAPEKIPGSADVMIESHIRTWIGLDIHQKVLGWSQDNHDDYVIYDIVFKNTGNVNRDSKIELPTQILDSLYLMRTFQSFPAASRDKEWASWTAPTDSLRMHYNYPSRQVGTTTDDFGGPRNDQNQQRLYGPQYCGEATLFVSKAPNDMVNDNPAQPQMRTIWDARLLYIKENALLHPNELDKAYDVMKRGVTSWTAGDPTYTKPPLYPGTLIEMPPDRGNVDFMTKIVPWGPTGRYHSLPMYSIGPFKLAPGDSIRLVYAIVEGSISKRRAFEIARDWYAKMCTPPSGFDWATKKDNLPPQYKAFPALYNNNQNDWAKDCWVATGKDSLFQNAKAAQWNVRQNYNIPTAPPPPSVEIQGRSNAIRIKWGKESESVPDFAGYRVYRTIGSYQDSAWVPIFECTKANLVHEYDDVSATRGAAYYYSVTAFDDGVSNAADFHGKKQSLESNMLATMTTRPTSLARPAVLSSLDSIRVVPNPFSLAAQKLQFPGQRDKIVFYGLPPECTIRIFSESGDLVKTIEHTRGSGDEFWGIGTINNDLQTTDTGQRPVSGIYIANIVTPDGATKNVKFLIVR